MWARGPPQRQHARGELAQRGIRAPVQRIGHARAAGAVLQSRAHVAPVQARERVEQVVQHCGLRGPTARASGSLCSVPLAMQANIAYWATCS